MTNSKELTMPRVIVCGDSVFDNTPYVRPGERDVRSFLMEYAKEWDIDFRAVDGAMCRDVANFQFSPEEPSCDAVIMSVGGNNALSELERIFDNKQLALMDHAHSLGLMQEEFRTEYRKALGNARETGRHLAVATIYRPRFHLDPVSGLRGSPEDILTTLNPLLSVFNDVIQEESARVGADVLDLRRICYKDEHFANPIEPSELGGRCIAEDLCAWLERLPADGLRR